MPDGTPHRKRRRRKCATNDGEQSESTSSNREIDESGNERAAALSSSAMPKRECPVPKPGGLVGEILGFRPPSRSGDGKGRPP